MALSNWDTVAWNEKGEPVRGYLPCPDGCVVSLYKNWAYVADPKAHRGTGEPFTDGIVLHFESGFTQYRRIRLYGKRGRQNSLFLAALYVDYKPDVCLALFGIGAYGFKGEEWVGIEPGTLECYLTWLRVTKEEQGFPIELPTLVDTLRYNQGDEYLANALGHPVSATSPGLAEKPVLFQLLEKEP